MHDYFKGWSRKIGVVTLLMACVGMAGWVQSASSISYIGGPIGRWTILSCLSLDRHLLIGIGQSKAASDVEFGFMPFVDFQTIDSVLGKDKIIEHYLWVRLASSPESRHGSGLMLVIPYWSIVIPLTLLSAFLLLKKNRQSTQKKIAEPVQVEGT